MTKQIITSIAVFVAALSVPASVAANEYGQEVKGETTEQSVVVHETVDTAVSDYINPSIVGAFFIGASGVFYMISKKAKVAAQKEAQII